MDVAELLVRDRELIIEAAESSLARLPAGHYRSAGAAEVRRRLETLFDHLTAAVASRDLTGMVEYAQSVAGERFDAGYDLAEVQTAFNALEEATWSRTLESVPPDQLADALGSVGTVLGCGKDALARTYVSRAAHTHAPSLDLRTLFRGTDGV